MEEGTLWLHRKDLLRRFPDNRNEAMSPRADKSEPGGKARRKEQVSEQRLVSGTTCGL